MKGMIMGIVAGWFPRITTIVGESMSTIVFPDGWREAFIFTVASVRTVISVLSLIALSVFRIGKFGTTLTIRERSPVTPLRGSCPRIS